MTAQLFRGIAERAVAMIQDGSVAGLGTGQAATAFIHVLGEHVRSGLRVPIQEQPLQVLRLLLEAEGRVVTREQLCAALWPENTFVDFEHGVNTAVKKLRQALEDRGLAVDAAVDLAPAQLLVLTGVAPRAVHNGALETLDTLSAVERIECTLDRVEVQAVP